MSIVLKFWTIFNPLPNWNSIILNIALPFAHFRTITHLKCKHFTIFEKITCGKFQLGMEHFTYLIFWIDIPIHDKNVAHTFLCHTITYYSTDWEFNGIGNAYIMQIFSNSSLIYFTQNFILYASSICFFFYWFPVS